MAGTHGVAILPFTDMSPQKDQEYFCEGLAEELINALSGVQGLRVIPRTSSFRFRTTDLGVRDIGNQLSVDFVIEGSVRKSGGKLRIIINLINIEDETPVWSQRYDRDITDVFEIQDDISKQVLEKLKTTFDFANRELPKNLRAYECYLQARHEWNKRTEESLKKSLELFKNAIAEDPGYAAAHAGLAEAYVTLAIYGALPPAEIMPMAEQSARKALQLKADLAPAAASLASVQAIFNWNWDEAIRTFEQAIEVDPGYALARQWFAINCLAPLGRLTEARDQIERAKELDPDSLIIRMTAAIISYFERRFDHAIHEYQEILQINPDFAIAHYFMGQAYLELKRHNESITELERAVELTGRSAETIAVLGYAHSVTGNMAEAVHLSLELTRRSTQIYVSPVLQAQIRVGLGDDAVFDLLDAAYEARSSDLVWIGIRPTWDPLRSDTRFVELCNRVGVSNRNQEEQ